MTHLLLCSKRRSMPGDGAAPLRRLHRQIEQMLCGAQGLATVEQRLLQMTYACTASLLSDTGMYPTVRGLFWVSRSELLFCEHQG